LFADIKDSVFLDFLMLIIMRASGGTSFRSQNERRKVFKTNKNCNSYFEQIFRTSLIISSTSPHNKNNGDARPIEQKCRWCSSDRAKMHRHRFYRSTNLFPGYRV